MGEPLPPDPYAALGVAKDATTEAIKKEYRKLALKFHPDKVKDEAKKQTASDLFHKIQTAYEIVGDEARRSRYDAQCKLVELRKDFDREYSGGRGGVEVRTPGYRGPPETPRGGDFFDRDTDYFARPAPQYEERRPSYVQEDYFEPRATSRKDADYERAAKRPSPRTTRGKAKGGTAKENDRSSRKEKNKQTDKDTRRDRERKFATVQVEEQSESDSDEFERARRRMRAEDEERRAARDAYYAQAAQQEEDAKKGFYVDERARKMFEQGAGAVEYMQRANQPRPSSERRPSPVRNPSSKNTVEFIKRKGGPPIMLRRGSDNPTKDRRDRRKSPPPRERDVAPSIEVEEASPRESTRRPPTFNHSKSSPADIRVEEVRPQAVRPPFERQRSHSLQEEHGFDPMPKGPRRSDTMPESPSEHPEREPRRDSRRKESSKLRSEFNDAYLTPEATPEPQPSPKRYNYGQDYADDTEFPTPDGYRTEHRTPERQRFARSPSPMQDRDRERQRTASARYLSPQAQPPPMPRQSSKTYIIRDGPDGQYARPTVSRENSNRLFGEVPTTRSPRQSSDRYTPPPNVSYTKEFRPEDIKIQAGYGRRSSERPNSYSRRNSAQHTVRVK